MPRLTLLNITPDVARLAENPAAFEAACGAAFAGQDDAIRGIVSMNESFRSRNGAPPEWGGYLAVDPESRRVVGSCAFKGSPIDGVVEIAFFTLPPYEGRGVAGEMVARLVEICRPTPAVRRVIAHTMPEDNAATSVLRKNGFRQVGEVTDAEDGRAWQWELWK